MVAWIGVSVGDEADEVVAALQSSRGCIEQRGSIRKV